MNYDELIEEAKNAHARAMYQIGQAKTQIMDLENAIKNIYLEAVEANKDIQKFTKARDENKSKEQVGQDMVKEDKGKR